MLCWRLIFHSSPDMTFTMLLAKVSWIHWMLITVYFPFVQLRFSYALFNSFHHFYVIHFYPSLYTKFKI
ncbi:hypothetical protein CW304_13400 [Bacillus sp. UFRGS-B20]|nr:hypothetical protein CW304_13400 [Bacillus sp. UFRGS-B20]